MAEQFLDAAQICAFFQQMRAEGVPQGVRMYVGGEATLDGNALDDASYRASGQSSVAAQMEIEHQRLGVALRRCQPCLALSQIGPHGLRRCIA